MRPVLGFNSSQWKGLPRQCGRRAIQKDAVAHEYGLTQRQAGVVAHLLEHGELWIEGHYKEVQPSRERDLIDALKSFARAM